MPLVEMLLYAQKKHSFFWGVDFKIIHPQLLFPHPSTKRQGFTGKPSDVHLFQGYRRDLDRGGKLKKLQRILVAQTCQLVQHEPRKKTPLLLSIGFRCSHVVFGRVFSGDPKM